MSKKMLIDASHREETRVAVISNGKVEDFDFESESRKPLRGNIYLARVTRVEPSLQAAFVEYGGNRHGFLAFSEIHSDYYQIPVSDRDILRKAEELEAELAAQMVADEQEEIDLDDDDFEDDKAEAKSPRDDSADAEADDGEEEAEASAADASEAEATDIDDEDDSDEHAGEIEVVDTADEEVESLGEDDGDDGDYNDDDSYKDRAALLADAASETATEELDSDDDGEEASEEAGASSGRSRKKKEKSLEERYRDARRERIRLLRNYRIQEVIKRRQILLVQVVKEERGNKGAALTTYLSLAGRYCVLMPNTSRGGGISRKIANGSDRKRLRKTMSELEIPPGLGLIIRTAGAKRTKSEIKRDYDYLLRLWENIRDLTMKSIAPCLIYEEASLIKRAIRDLYDKDITSVTVEGEAGYREAKDFMKMLMPSHAKNVQPWRKQVPMFLANKVEQQLDEMYQPVVKLKSGGYLVIQQTEALISIDVNSGKATKERNIEATALKTNCEAAVEVARQCRLRDLAGLVVVDFIDMEESRNNRTVEKKLKDAMKTDRARIQLGRISTFGLLEMSRQRRRSGIVDGTTRQCPTCHGAGAVRSHEMAALRILRAVEEEALAGRAGVIAVSTSTEVALYILNNKREWLNRIEETYALTVEINADPDKAGDTYDIEKRGPAREAPPQKAFVTADLSEMDEPEAEIEEEVEDDTDEEEIVEEEERPSRRRRRSRRSRSSRSSDSGNAESSDDEDSAAGEQSGDEGEGQSERSSSSEDGEEDGGGRRRRRRGRRGGRRNRRRSEGGEGGENAEAQENASEDNQSEDKAEAGDTGGEPGAPANDTNGHDGDAETQTVAAEAADEGGDSDGTGDQSGDSAEEPAAEAPVVEAEPVAAEAEEAPQPEEAPVAPVAEEQPVAETEKPAAEEPVAAVEADEPEAAEDEAAEEEPAASAPEEEPEDDDRPKRTGWWQRALGKN